MSFHTSSLLILNAALVIAACGDSGSGGSNQGGAGGAGGSTANGQGGLINAGGDGGSGPSLCDAAQAEQNAKYRECGVDIGQPGTGGGGGAPTVECTAAYGELAVCLKDCVLAAPCGGLDGTDKDAGAAFGACTTEC